MRVLLLSTNSDDLMIHLWCLRQAGHVAVALGSKGNHKNDFYKFFCKKMYFLNEEFMYSNFNKEILVNIKEIVSKEDIEVVMATGFNSVKFIARYRDEIEKMASVIPLPTLDMINLLGDKFSFSSFCKENNIPHPETFLLKEEEDVNLIKSSLKYPLFMKPLDRTSGEGVERIDNEDTLMNRLSIKKQGETDEFPVILQELIPGEDVDLNGYCLNGEIMAWTIHRMVRVPLTKDKTLGWHQFIKDEKVLNVARQVIQCSGYTGPLNLDMRYDERDGSVKTIEVNTRFWATTVFSLCDGVNFPDTGIELTVNSEFRKSPLYSNRVWGSPHWLPLLLVKYHNRQFLRYATAHSWQQFKFMIFKIIPERILGSLSRNRR